MLSFIRYIFVFGIICFSVDQASANPIYVFKEPDGSIRFTNKKPQEGTNFQVFTAKRSKYNVYSMKGSLGMRPGRSSKLFKDTYNEIIHKAALLNQLEPSLIKAVIHVESAFNSKAVSPKGARGLMQLMPGTAKDLGVKNSFVPEENIHGGARHLSRLVVKFNGNLRLALAAYNAGEESVARHNGIPPFTETQNYVRRVMELKGRYGQLKYG